MEKQKREESQTVKKSFIVQNDYGLHTRPATEIVRCCAQFQSQIKLRNDHMEVDAKSILGVLVLAAAKGTEIQVIAKGVDAEQAVDALIALSATHFKCK